MPRRSASRREGPGDTATARRPTRIFVYVQTADSGFAPNPFHGWCTLACCKPAIRRRAREGDWVVGLTPRADGNRLVYAMRVDATLTFEQYWADPRFEVKRPPATRDRPRIERCGDNCYQPIGAGGFAQIPWSRHWDKPNLQENLRAKAKDLGGKRVLVSRDFSYFGERPQELPPELLFKRPERFNRVISGGRDHEQLLRYLESLDRGLHGRPRHWPPDDRTWKEPPPPCG